MPLKVGSESLCQYWLMLAVCRATSAEVERCVCTTTVRSELVNGCGGIDYTEKIGAGNEVPTLGRCRPFPAQAGYGYQGTRMIWPLAPGSRISLCARATSARGNCLPTTGRSVPFSRPA